LRCISTRRVAERELNHALDLFDLAPLAGCATPHLYRHLYWRRLERTSQATNTNSTRLAAKVPIIQA
jgi:hypothetical protein